MRKPYLFFLMLVMPVLIRAQDYPRPTNWVSDFAGVIPAEQKAQISAVARELKQKTGAELAVATIRSLGGASIEVFANDLYRAWGVGEKGKDNGILILLAVEDRKVWIEVGYGFEPILPDGRVGGILDRYVVPDLSRNDFGSGLLGGTLAVAGVIAGDAGVTLTGVPRQPYRQPGVEDGSRGGGIILIIIFILLIILTKGRIIPWLLFAAMMGGGRSGGGGGGFGGGGFGGGFGGFG
ncbi:MAG TPA: TPM domain-containing protein, partial [bacterium]|nr:TPM domain-containing protein [bacterium]